MTTGTLAVHVRIAKAYSLYCTYYSRVSIWLSEIPKCPGSNKFFFSLYSKPCAFSALTLLVGRLEVQCIQLVKIEWWGVGVVICLERGADRLHMVQLMPPHAKTPSSLASFKSRLVLPFWYQLTQAVLEKRLLNGCSSLYLACQQCPITHHCVSIQRIIISCLVQIIVEFDCRWLLLSTINT